MTTSLSTNPASSENFFRTVYSPRSPKLAFQRVGVFWEAAKVASDLALRGAGRRIAIVDSGFDLSIERLARLASPHSVTSTETIATYGHHGTVVALLVHEIAPDAELVLIDVHPLSRESVGDAIHRAIDVQADIINLSLEQPSDCRFARKGVYDVDVALSADPGVGPFRDNLEAWLAGTEFYEPFGCRTECAVCNALTALSDASVVISAAGNVNRTACPACHHRCTGVGFRAELVVPVGEAELLTSGSPEGFEQNVITDFTIAQPPGFHGTSFASPLLTGLAAVVADARELIDMTRMPMAMYPVATLLAAVRRTDQPTESQLEALNEGFTRLIDELPAHHRHWNDTEGAPCVSCSLSMVDWYRDYTSFLASWWNTPGSITVGRAGAHVAPYSPQIIGNLGVAYRVLASMATELNERRGHLEEAVACFRRAATQAGSSAMFYSMVDAVDHELATLVADS